LQRHRRPATLTNTRHNVPLVRGHDFQFDAKSQKLTVPFDSAETLIIHGAGTLFAATPSAARQSTPN